MPNLTQPNLKVGRAKMHLDALNEAVRGFRDSNPQHLSTADDVERDEFVITVWFDDFPLPDVMIAGDFIGCLRSSLDYLAWQLALLTTNHPSRDICFPICEKDSLDTQLRITKSTYQIPDEAVSIMKMLQPYNHGDAYKLSSLWRLNKLWNIDKHRHITFHSIFTEFYFPPGIPHPKVEVIGDKNIMRFPLSAKPKVPLDPRVPVEDVWFGDDSEGIVLPSESFSDIYKFVTEEVFPRFAGFFPQAKAAGQP